MRREEGGTEAEEGKLLLNEIRTAEQCASCGQWNGGEGVLGVGGWTHVTCGV